MADRRRKIINVDLDGVIYPFHIAVTRMMENWLQYYAPKHMRMAGPLNLEVPKRWDFWQQWGVSGKVYFEEFWPWAVERGVFNHPLAPIEGAAEAMRTLRDAGYHIRIVTHKPIMDGYKHHAIADAVQWLSWNRIEYDSIIFDDEKWRYHAEYAIDDKPEGDKWMSAISQNIVFAQPWNDNYVPHGAVHHVRLVGWPQVVDHILAGDITEHNRAELSAV